MSRIYGWFDFKKDLRHFKNDIEAMAAALDWRKENRDGRWQSREACLGQQVWHAHSENQPLVHAAQSGNVVLVIDGEIYNAEELRDQLKRNGSDVATDTHDAALLMEAYLLWGGEFVHHVNGIFAFAIRDERINALLIGRDRLGVKPLYYFSNQTSILFASELKCFLAHSACKAKLNYKALPILLQPRLSMPGETGLMGVCELAPGHLLEVTEQGFQLTQYWKLESRQHTHDFEETVECVAHYLKDAVYSQATKTFGSGQVGSMLSGGLDSTSVLALSMQELKRRNGFSSLHSYCLEYEDHESHFTPSDLRPDIDAPYAEQAARILGSQHHRIVSNLESLAAAETFTRSARDFPAWGQFDASMYELFSQMRSQCDVVMTGEIADELFGGYPYCFDETKIFESGFPWLGSGPKLSSYLSDSIKNDIRPEEDEVRRYNEILQGMSRLDGENTRDAKMREILFLGLAGPTNVLIDRMERMTAANGLQIRLPFCDYRLMEYVWNVPWEFKSRGGVKGLLKAAVQNDVPQITLNRKKSAYPHIQNPAYDIRIINETKALLNNPHSAVSALFDVPKLKSLVSQVEEGKITAALPGSSGAAKLLIHLVELEHWVNKYKVSI